MWNVVRVCVVVFLTKCTMRKINLRASALAPRSLSWNKTKRASVQTQVSALCMFGVLYCSIATCLTWRRRREMVREVSDAAINAVMQHSEEQWHPAASQPLCLFVLMQRDDGTEGGSQHHPPSSTLSHTRCRIYLFLCLRLFLGNDNIAMTGLHESVLQVIF